MSEENNKDKAPDKKIIQKLKDVEKYIEVRVEVGKEC